MGHGMRSPRRALVVIAIVASAAVAGCGGDDEPNPSEAAQAAADDFVGAIGSGDFDAACAALTEELAAQLGGDACPEQIGQLAGEDGEVEIEVTDVRVSGPKAVADTEVHRQGAGAQESSFELVDSDDGWKVSRIGD